MKKILLLTNLLFIPLFLEPDTQDFEITFLCHKPPTYCVKLPTKLDITRRDTSFEYYVKGDIYGDQILNVEFEPECSINNFKNDYLVQVYVDKSTWSAIDLTTDYTSSTVRLSHDELPSGNYSGELCIKIYLQEGENYA